MHARTKQKLTSLRSFLGAGAFALVGLLGILGTFDLSPIVGLFVTDPATLPIAMLLIGIFFGVLHYYTASDTMQIAAQRVAPKNVDQGV